MSWSRLRRVMQLPARHSVRGKLIRVVLVTTAIAVCIAGVAMLTVDLSRYQKSWASDLSTEAAILAVSAAPALAFGDREAAMRNVAALSARPRVMAAALYSADGKIYASFVRDGSLPLPSSPPPVGIRTFGERVELAHLIERNGEELGTIYLRARYDIEGRVEAYFGIFVIVTLLSLAVAFFLSQGLQRGITGPLDAMAEVAREIVHRRDYSLRVKKISDDEIGIVVDAFNNMLEEVGTRSRALEDFNLALTEEIEVRKSTQAALSMATARLESTMAAAEIGSWLWDIRTNEFTADRNLTALYGLDEDALNGPPDLHHRHIHPDDLGLVRKAELNALSSGVFASTEFRVVLPNGTERWMARRGKVQLDQDRRAIFISGLLIDITAQKKAEEALRTSEKLYRAIGESINYGVWVCDRQGRNIYASESFLRLLGKTQEQCSNLGWGDALHPDDAAATLEAWRECVKSGTVWYREHRMRGADGHYHPILAQGVPIRAEDGEISGWAGINLDINRLKHTEEALREADRRKDEFLATLAHELRNPLAPIRHAVKLLESKTIDESQHQWARQVISRQVYRMALLLDDLLDVSRITRGRLDLKIERVSLSSLVEAAVETARPLIDSKQHKLTIELPNPVMVAVDPLRVSQALSNLLTNAAKYTDAKGEITIKVCLSPAEIDFTVKDNGIGFEPGALTGMFEMFSQVDSAIERSEGGLGIGLSLVKGLIELHGGRVEASSGGLGCGSEFKIHLPRSAIVSDSIEPQTDRNGVNAISDLRFKVLVADDNRDAADSLALLLEMSGHIVMVVHTGEEALEMAAQARPHAMILDIGMPGLTGYEVAQRVRAETWGKGVYLVAVTGWGQKEDKERALSAGFDDHLTKPVDPDQIEGLLQAHFSVRANLRA